MNKRAWKKHYRLLRVVKREASKASEDMMLFGTGAIMIPDDGSDPYRIHPKNLLLVQ